MRKPQVFLDIWKTSCEDIDKIVKITTKACFRLWNLENEILDQFDMPKMDELNQEVPKKIQIVEVEQTKFESKQSIEQIGEMNK
jgi:thiol-disulfide isomerase/thioredoxin